MTHISDPKLQPNENVDLDILPHFKYHKELRPGCSGFPMRCQWILPNGRSPWWMDVFKWGSSSVNFRWKGRDDQSEKVALFSQVQPS